MIKDIITIADQGKLTQKSEPITDPKAEGLNALLIDLFGTAVHHATTGKRGCVGLAANQIGVLKRVFVMRYGNRFIAVVNPVVLKRSESTTYAEEGCLSLPGMRGMGALRPKWVKVMYLSPAEQGKIVTKKFKGRDARVFLHEMDHLNGILI